jgi:hypothetical protein
MYRIFRHKHSLQIFEEAKNKHIVYLKGHGMDSTLEDLPPIPTLPIGPLTASVSNIHE